MKNPVCWWEICTKDAGKLAKFYSEAFGWEQKDMPGMGYTVMDSGDGKNGGIGGGVFSPKEGEEMPPYLTMYIAVDDVDATVAKVKELGATVTCEPFDVPKVGRIAMFNDPQGHMVGMIKSAPMEGESG